MKLDPGTIIERYVVEEILGAGGTAMVYLVKHRSLGTRHALKVLTLTSSAIRDRMLREGQVQAALQHPNVVAVTDIVDIDGQPGLLMEHIVGPSLERALNKYKLTMGDAEVLFQGIVAGVRAAHNMGLVHRDLKPANVLLQRTQAGFVPKVTDFGLAKLLEADPEVAHTRSGIAMGTPSYMAPEQVRDARSVDQRADLWSLGCLLYELMTRRRTFPGDEALAIYNAVTHGEFQPPRELVDGLPDRVEQAIHGCLCVDREARIPDCETLQAVLSGDKQWPLPQGLTTKPRAPISRSPSMVSNVPAMTVASEASAAGSARAGSHSQAAPAGGALEQATAVRRMPPPIDPSAGDEAETVLVSRSSIDATLFPSEQSLSGESHEGEEPEGRVWLYVSVVVAALAAVVVLLFAFGAVVGSVVLTERAGSRVPKPAAAPVAPRVVPRVVAPETKPVAAPAVEPAPKVEPTPAPVEKPAAPVEKPTPPQPKPKPTPAAPVPVPVVPVPAPAAPVADNRAQVKFFSYPGGADLWVGGYRRGRTPTPLDLEAGTYEVQMQQHGGTPHNWRVQVEPGADAVWCYVFTTSSAVAGPCPATDGGVAP